MTTRRHDPAPYAPPRTARTAFQPLRSGGPHPAQIGMSRTVLIAALWFSKTQRSGRCLKSKRLLTAHAVRMLPLHCRREAASVPEGVAMSSEAQPANDDLVIGEDLQSRIEAMLVFGDGTWINLCYAIVEILEEATADERPALIEFVAENLGFLETSKELQIPEYITFNHEKEMRDKYGKVVNQLLALILRENLPEREFYTKVWDLVQNPIFVDKESRAFCFYYIIIDRQLPYFQIGIGRKMSEANWAATADRLAKEGKKVRFLLLTEFPQKSEQASLILDEIEQLDDEEDRIWLLAQALNEIRLQGERKYASLRDTLAQGDV